MAPLPAQPKKRENLWVRTVHPKKTEGMIKIKNSAEKLITTHKKTSMNSTKSHIISQIVLSQKMQFHFNKELDVIPMSQDTKAISVE